MNIFLCTIISLLTLSCMNSNNSRLDIESVKKLEDFSHETDFFDLRKFIDYQKDSIEFKKALNECYKRDSVYLYRFITRVIQSEFIYEQERKVESFFFVNEEEYLKEDFPLYHFLFKHINLKGIKDLKKISNNLVMKLLAKKDGYSYRDLWYRKDLRGLHKEANNTEDLRSFENQNNFKEMRLFLYAQKDSLGFINALHDCYYEDSIYLYCFISKVLLSQAIYEIENNRGVQSLFMSSSRTDMLKIRKTSPLTYYFIKYIDVDLKSVSIFPSSMIFCILRNEKLYPEIWDCEDNIKTFKKYEKKYKHKKINCPN